VSVAFLLLIFLAAAAALGPSQMELPVELRSMRRRYAPLGQTYVAALRAEVALAAELAAADEAKLILIHVLRPANAERHLARRTVEDLRRGRFAFAWNRLRYSGMGPVDWLRYLRWPRRNAFAGTPLDADGEFHIPAWARPRGGSAGPA